jgi:hypothetical protein
MAVGTVTLQARSIGVTRARRALLLVGIVVFLTGGFSLLRSGDLPEAGRSWSLDYDLNWVAARRLVDHEDLYDRAAARAEGVRRVGPEMRETSRDAFSSYIGSPAVALLHAPFLAFDHDTGAQVFRVLGLLEIVAAIVLAAFALPATSRLPATLIGLGALCWGFPLIKSYALGQGNGMIMLGLAAAVWAAPRERWGLAGVGLGVATVLKISPVLLVAYLVLRGRRKVGWSAGITVLATLAMAAAVGRPADLLTWIRDVTPQVSKGTISAYNQSIVAALARLVTSATDFSSHAAPGGWYLLAYALWGAALFGLWRVRRSHPIDPLELGFLVVVVVLAGPLTWDHYFLWTLVPLVLMADAEKWALLQRTEAIVLAGVLALSVAMLHAPIPLPSPEGVASHWMFRVATDRYAASALLMTGAAAWLLVRAAGATRDTRDLHDDGATTVGAALPMVAGGIHERR